MSNVDVGTAFVRVVPDTSQFRSLLQAQVNAAVAQIKVPPIVASVTTASGTVGANVAASSAAAKANLRGIEKSSEAAAKGILSAKNESRLLQGSLIGLSRVTPVAVFGLGLVGTAAIAAGLAIKGSINSAAELQQQLQLFQAVSGATEDQMRSVSASANQLGADLSLPATSAGDAATAMTELAKAGLSVQDSLDAARGVLQLSAAANVSAGEAAKITATQLNAFGLAGQEAAKVSNLLAGASVAAQGEITDFAAAFQQVSAAANTADISVETTTALLTELAKAGIRGADAGTSLRTMILRLVPTTKEAAQFQKALGIELNRNATIGEQLPALFEQYRTALLRLPPADKIEAINQIFGQDAFRSASVVLTQGVGSLERLQDQVSAVGQDAKLAEARTKGFAGSLEGLKSTSSTLGTTLGTAVLPALTDGVHVLSEFAGAANEAAKATASLASITVKPLVGAAGGGDVVAQAAFAVAVGLGVKKLLEMRAASRLAARAATDAIRLEGQLAATASLMYAKLSTSAVAAADVQIGAATSVTSALARQTVIQKEIIANNALITSSTATANASVVASYAATTRKILASNKGLIAGLVASVAGGQLESQGGAAGTVGSILSGAGTGAVIGSFIPVPGGIAIGAGVGAGLAAMSQVVADKKRDKAKVQAEFDKLSFSEQQEFLRRFPSAGNPFRPRGPADITSAAEFIESNDLTPKSNPFSAITGSILSSTATVGGGDLLSQAFGQATFKAGVTNKGLIIESFGKALKQENIKIPQTSAELDQNRQLQLDLSLAIASVSGSTQQITAALRGQVEFDKKKIAAIEAQLTNFSANKLGLSVQERTALNEALVIAYNNLAASEKAVAAAAAEAFRIPASVTIAGIAAGATQSLSDDLSNARKVVRIYRDQLQTTKLTGDELDSIRISLAEAEAKVVGIQRQISDQSKANAEKAIEEARKKSAAQEQLRQTIIDIQLQRFDNRLTSAQLTPGLGDDRRELNGQIRFFETLKKNAETLRDKAKQGSQAQADARKRVEVLSGEILGLKTALKNLNSDSSSFSLQDLFQEAVNQFNTFGSNIAGRNGVLSAQDERAAFGQTAVKNAGEALAAASLTQQERQTALLESINSKLIVNPQGGIPVTGNRGRIGGLTAIEEADRLAANGVLN